MKVKELIDICGKDNADKRGILCYFDCSSRSKYPKIIALHEDNIEADSESENITIAIKVPKKEENDESDTTMSVKDLSDWATKNKVLDYCVFTEATFDSGWTISGSLIKEDIGFDDEGWVYLCY